MNEQLTLFAAEPGVEPQQPAIPGSHYLSAFLTPEEEAEFIRLIDENEDAWLTDLSRRVQHYGWRYDYSERTITSDMRIGPLPDWLQQLALRLYEKGYFDRPPEQVIVNEYESGQGIAMHTDHSDFGPAVAMVSLGDEWQMDFSRSDGDTEAKSHMMLERGSALILTGEARKKWRHSIAKRKTEGPHRERNRKRRLSLTFRTVNQPVDAQ